MKKLLMYFIVFFANIALAQAEDYQYLTSSKDIAFSGAGGFSLGIDTQPSKGGHGGFLINDTFLFGMQGESSINLETKEHSKYGGLLLGVNLFSKKVVHPTLKVVLGVGRLTNTFEPLPKDTASFYVAKYILGAQINFAKWLRITPNIGYRLTAFEEGHTDKNGEYSGLTYGVSFDFGHWKSK